MGRSFKLHIASDPAYKALNASPYFRKAIAAFSAFEKRGSVPPHIPGERAFAHFLWSVSFRMMLYQFYKERDIPRLYPTKKTIGKAIAGIDALLALKYQWLFGMDGWQKCSAQLSAFRATLRSTLPTESRRARRREPNQVERKFVEDLISDFISTFDNPLRKSILNLSFMVGYSDNESVVDERIRAAQK